MTRRPFKDGVYPRIGSRSGALARELQFKIGRFSKTRMWIYQNYLLLNSLGFSVQRIVLVNRFLRLLKQPIFSKLPGFKGKGS